MKKSAEAVRKAAVREFKRQAVRMSHSSEVKQLLGNEPSGFSKADPVCATARVAIKTSWHANQSDQTTISLALDDCIEADSTVFTDAKLAAAIKHASQCKACLQWRRSELEPERYERVNRSQAYCCTEMSDAVHGANAGLPVRFGLAGPENLPCWWVAPSRTVIRHCPWCGSSLTRLPQEVQAFTGTT